MDLTMLLGPGDAASQTRRSDGKQAAGAAGALFHGLLAGAITRDEREPVEAADGVTPLGPGGVDAEAPSDAQAPESAPALGADEDPESTEAAATGDAEKVPVGGGDVLTATLGATVTSVPPSPQFTLIPLPDPLSDAPLVQPALQGPPLVQPSLNPAGGTVLLAGVARPDSAASAPANTEAALTRLGAQPAALGAATAASGSPAPAPAASTASTAVPAEQPESLPLTAAPAPAATPNAAPAPRSGEARLDAVAVPTATEGQAAASAAALARDDSAPRRLSRQLAGRPSASTERGALRGDARTAATGTGGATLPGVAITASEGALPAAQTPGEAQAEPVPAASGDRAPRPAATSAPTLARETPSPALALAGEPPASAASQELAAAPEMAESTPLPVRELPERTLRALSELRADGETHYRAEFELDPPALGRVRLEVELDGEGRRSLTRFTVESHAAHEQLQAELPRLRALLAEQGLGDAQVELQLKQGGSQGQPQGEGRSRSWREGLRAEREAPAITSTWRSGHDGLIDLRA